MGVSLLRRLAAVLLGLAGAGCSPLTFSEGPVGPEADPARGEFRIRAPRRGRADGQARGYVYQVVGPDLKVLASVDSRGGPWSFENLDPGRYGLQISGKEIHPLAVDVKIKPGIRTTVSFHASRARAAKAPEDLAIVTGKAVLYVVLAVGYGVGYLCWEAIFGDDDEDEDDDHVAPSPAKREPSTPDPEPSRPRVRSLLKDP